MSKRKPQPKTPPNPQPAPPFDGSTFAEPAPLVKPSAGLPAGVVTAPDADTACRLKVFEDAAARIGNPPDFCHLWIRDKTLLAFRNLSERQIASVLQNTLPNRLMLPGWVEFEAMRLSDERLHGGLGNYDMLKVLPNTLAICAQITDEQLAAVAAAITPQNYPKTPYAVATGKPAPLGGGL